MHKDDLLQEKNQPPLRVFDLHCDTLDRLALEDCPEYPAFAEQNKKCGIAPERLRSLKDNDAHLSFDRMSAFDWCQCFAVFIPDVLTGDNAWHFYERVRNFFYQQLAKYPAQVTQIFNTQSVEGAHKKGQCGAFLTIEGGSFLEGSLDHLEAIAQDGVRMLTLTWNGRNAIASGNDTDAGLSSWGKEVIRVMEEKRIVVDVSHLNDKSFFDVAAVAQRPVVASHSNARAVCKHPRNLTDKQFRLIAEQKGLVGLNFCTQFLLDEERDPNPEEVLQHIDHWLTLGGEEVIALGSDYDGADVPSWLMPGDKLAVLYAQVVRAFGEVLADKLFYSNAYQFFLRNDADRVV